MKRNNYSFTMSNLSNQDLFVLIKSLTKSEKRYLKMTFKQSGGETRLKTYLKMFEMIDKQLEYNEDKLYFALQKYMRLNRHKFANIKYVLYQKILMNIRYLYREHNPNFEIQGLLEQTAILYHKTLYQQSFTVLQKARRIILKREVYSYMPQVTTWENRLSQYVLYSSTYNSSIEEDLTLLEETKLNIELLELLTKVKLIHQQQGKVNILENKHELLCLIDNMVMNQSLTKFSFRVRLSYYEINALYHISLNNYQHSYGYYQKLMKLWEENDSKKKFFSEEYIKHIFEYLWIGIVTNLSADYKIYLTEIETALIDFIPQEAQELLISVIECLECLAYASPTELTEKLEDISQKDRQACGIFWEFRIQQMMSMGYFLVNDLQNALRYNYILKNDKYQHIYSTHKCFLRIWNIILDYEIGNLDVLDYTYRSANRFFKKQEYDTTLEIVLLKKLRKLYNAVDNEDTLKIISEIEDYLYRLPEQDLPWQKLEYNLLQTWIKGKLSKTSFLETYRSLVTKKQLLDMTLEM